MNTDAYILLVDGDNVNYTYLDPFIEYIQKNYGAISSIHLFGKLESSYLGDWKRVGNTLIGKTICYNTNENCKNNTDIQMIHFAWKCFYRDNVHKFIIMSSDSDMQAVVSDLCTEAEVIIGYSRQKVSTKYLQFLKERKVLSVDMDSVRGDLTEEGVSSIIKYTAQSYLEYKLGNQFFSYDTIVDWIHERYPDIKNVDRKKVLEALGDYKISFDKNGVKISMIDGG